MRIRNFATLFLMLSFCISVNAQEVHTCGFDHKHQKRMETDPAYRASVEAFSRLAQAHFKENKAQQRSFTPVYNIPVVVHVLYKTVSGSDVGNISTTQIQSAITNLNDAFSGAVGASSDASITFCLASTDPDGLATTGINRVDLTAFGDYAANGITDANEASVKANSTWPSDQYYNVWLVTEIDNNEAGSGTQGYAYLPGLGAVAVDGTVQLYNTFGYDPTGALGYDLKSSANENETFTHETGHYFSLRHTFEGDNDGASCPTNTDCLTDGDEICDTEPHIRTVSTCPTGSTNTCTGAVYGEVLNNYMNYTSETCQDRFTANQITRMRLSASLGTYFDGTFVTTGRYSHTNSNGCETPPTSLPSGVYCSDVSNGDFSKYNIGAVSIQIGEIDHNNFTAYYDSIIYGTAALTIPEGTTHEEGESVDYTLDLNAFNNGNSNQAKIFIDYDNDNNFTDSGEEVVVTSGDGSGANTFSGSFTIPASGVTKDTPLKLRVVSDFTGFNNGTAITSCSVTYGQMEDFFIVVTAPLPVDLLYFEAERVDDHGVIKWATALEQNNDHFRIEKSIDGINFYPLAEIQGQGNSLETTAYSYKDKALKHGANYYRLVQVDFDGTSETHGLRVVQWKEDEALFSVFPNPVSTNTLNLKKRVEDVPLQLQIFDVTGKMVLQSYTASQQYFSQLDISDLEAGYYLITGKSGRETLRIPFVKL